MIYIILLIIIIGMWVGDRGGYTCTWLAMYTIGEDPLLLPIAKIPTNSPHKQLKKSPPGLFFNRPQFAEQ